MVSNIHLFNIPYCFFIDIREQHIQLDTYKLHGSESRQFYVLHIYDIKFVPEKGYWVPYSRGQLTASLTSDTLKALVSSRN